MIMEVKVPMVVQIPTKNLQRLDGLEDFRKCRLHNSKLHLLAVFESTKNVRVAHSMQGTQSKHNWVRSEQLVTAMISSLVIS